MIYYKKIFFSRSLELNGFKDENLEHKNMQGSTQKPSLNPVHSFFFSYSETFALKDYEGVSLMQETRHKQRTLV